MQAIEGEKAGAFFAREECQYVMHAYCVTQDMRDAKGFSDLFTSAGEWRKSDGETVVGRQAIRDHVAALFKRHEKLGIVYRHMLTSGHVTVDEAGGAHGVFFSLVYRVEGEGAVRDTRQPTALMTYDVLFGREDAKWKIVRYSGVNHI